MIELPHRRKGVAMAEAKNADVHGMSHEDRPQLFQEIKRNDSVITCESCSRILFSSLHRKLRNRN